MDFILGAYATSPSLNGWDPSAETRYFDALKKLQHLRGLEHPFFGTLHQHDDDWFLENYDPRWDIVLTLIPGTMSRLAADPHHGLASENKAGRSDAIKFAAAARDAAQLLNEKSGRRSVVAIELHSAPSLGSTGARSSAAALADSLAHLAQWEWQGARLCIEHCDAFQRGREPAKGFLPLDKELEAIAAANASSETAIGIIINWGRSVLETRRASTAVEHIELARASGALAGVIFSGCSGTDSPWGVWSDSHMPHGPARGLRNFAEDSLLTESSMEDCLRAAGPAPDIVGAKITAFPSIATLERRLGLNRDILALLRRVSARVSSS